jgi:hypothetical protein
MHSNEEDSNECTGKSEARICCSNQPDAAYPDSSQQAVSETGGSDRVSEGDERGYDRRVKASSQCEMLNDWRSPFHRADAQGATVVV